MVIGLSLPTIWLAVITAPAAPTVPTTITNNAISKHLLFGFIVLQIPAIKIVAASPEWPFLALAQSLPPPGRGP